MSRKQQYAPYQTNYTNPNLGPMGNPLGENKLNVYVPGGVGTPGNPMQGEEVNITAKRTFKDKWKNALNQSKTMLKGAWDKLKENQVISQEELSTTANTNFKMNIVNKAMAGPENKTNQQNYNINRSELNPKHGLLPNSFLGGAYGGAGSYKV